MLHFCTVVSQTQDHMCCYCSSRTPGSAVDWGTSHESEARAEYEALMQTKVAECGLTLHPAFPYLGASPDGIVDDSTILEIKCPYTGRDKSVKELVNSGYRHIEMDENNQMKLKCSSEYYCQVQGEMALTNRTMTHLVIWTPVDTEIISVPYDTQFWTQELLPKLKNFYVTHICPKFVREA